MFYSFVFIFAAHSVFFCISLLIAIKIVCIGIKQKLSLSNLIKAKVLLANKTQSEDTSLIAKARQGDKAAFGQLVQKYEKLVATTVASMLGRGEDAEDVGQQVFIRFYDAMHDFRGEAQLSTYLTRIAINLSLNEIKRRKRKNSLFFSRRSPEQEKEFDIVDQQNHQADYDTKEAVNKALQRLDPKFRAVVVLRMMQGYTSEETAKILKLPLGTVLSRLSRAQDKLKKILTHLLH